MSVILASQSASRKAMLEAAGVDFVARPAHLDERAVEAGLAGAGPAAVARALLGQLGRHGLAGLFASRADDHGCSRADECASAALTDAFAAARDNDDPAIESYDL